MDLQGVTMVRGGVIVLDEMFAKPLLGSLNTGRIRVSKDELFASADTEI